MPAAGDGMAEGVEASARVACGRRSGGVDDAGGANGGRDGAGLQNAHADRARALVPGSGNDRRALRNAEKLRGFGGDMRADLRGLKDLRQPGLGNAGHARDLARPAAVGDVEQQRARGLLYVDGVGAGHAEAHVILRAEHVRDAREDLGLVVADPEQLGEREVGQRRIGGELDELFAAHLAAPELLMQPVALRLRTLVAPDERGTQNRTFFIEHDGAVHLAGEADGLNFRAGRLRERFSDGLLRGTPPVIWVLLGPAWLRGAEGSVLCRGRSGQLAGGADENGARAARTDIQT